MIFTSIGQNCHPAAVAAWEQHRARLGSGAVLHRDKKYADVEARTKAVQSDTRVYTRLRVWDVAEHCSEWPTGLHEAGHVVVAIQCGASFNGVRVNSDGTGGLDISQEAIDQLPSWHAAALCFAGGIAEAMLLGHEEFVISNSDHAQLQRARQRSRLANLSEEGVTLAKSILNGKQKAVKELAGALVAAGSLKPRTCREIVKDNS